MIAVDARLEGRGEASELLETALEDAPSSAALTELRDDHRDRLVAAGAIRSYEERAAFALARLRLALPWTQPRRQFLRVLSAKAGR